MWVLTAFAKQSSVRWLVVCQLKGHTFLSPCMLKGTLLNLIFFSFAVDAKHEAFYTGGKVQVFITLASSQLCYVYLVQTYANYEFKIIKMLKQSHYIVIFSIIKKLESQVFILLFFLFKNLYFTFYCQCLDWSNMFGHLF